jgi:dTMP kinase
MPGEGRLIVLEGMDDALLEAQAARLCRWLRDGGIAVEGTREPTHGPVGAQIRLAQGGRLQIDAQSLALFSVADRMDHLGREGGILAQLAEGCIVVCVHYLLCSYAQQWDEVERAWLRQINARCRTPDLTLFIDAPPPAGGGLRQASFGYAQDRQGRLPDAGPLRERYVRVIERLASEGECIVTVDGRGTADEIQSACRQAVMTLGIVAS